jgi:prevent-host-death family protein
MGRLFYIRHSSRLIDMVVMTSMIIMKFLGWIMITETSAVNFRQNLGEMLNQVQYRHDSVVINKDGKPVAVLVDTGLFERIRRMQDRFDALCRRIEVGYAAVPEADGLAEIEAAVQTERSAHVKTG